MTVEEAKEALAYHSCGHEDIHSPRWERGFVGSLRPFTGTLNRDAMREMEVCLRVLAPMLQEGYADSRELVTGFLYVIATGQHWAVAPESMLRRNKLISAEDIALLTSWLAEFSMAFAMIVEGMDTETAFEILETKY